MKKMFAFILSALLLFSIAAPACASETGNGLVAERWIGSGDSAAYYVSPGQTSHKKGDHSSGWYVRAEGVLGAAVTDKDGNETQFEIHTDKETVGEALQELNLIDGEEGEYGLFVKTVNGITADYDTDGVYWAFYVNGEYATSGVDVTQITEGDSYALKVE